VEISGRVIALWAARTGGSHLSDIYLRSANAGYLCPTDSPAQPGTDYCGASFGFIDNCAARGLHEPVRELDYESRRELVLELIRLGQGDVLV